jgi:Ser/Thr protein kinase RdoA (MazF antagonist)
VSAPKSGSDDRGKEAPFASLSFDLMLDALLELGLEGDGTLVALNSYENRVYQVGIEGKSPVIVKFYRPNRWSDAQILEEHAFTLELAEREIPVVPALDIGGNTLHHAKQFAFAVFERRGGRAPDIEHPETLAWLGRFLGRIHAVGALKRYAVRPTLDLATFGEEPRAWLLKSDFIPKELRESYAAISALALEGVRNQLSSTPTTTQRVHGDCHIGNVLWTDSGPHFVDFDDSRMAPAVQDLWMLLSGSRDDQAIQMRAILSGYQEFADFDIGQLRIIEALRTLRLVHYSAWLARRWHDPAFPSAFPWFASVRYWEERISELRDQIAALSDEPLSVY